MTVAIIGDILITGAGGFVGTRLVAMLRSKNFYVSSYYLGNNQCRIYNNKITTENITELNFSGIRTVIHLAYDVTPHRGREAPGSKLMSDDKDLQLTEALAKRAVACGVEKFIFLSTIGVNGMCTSAGKRFCEKDSPNPSGDYAISKFRSELILSDYANKNGLKVVIVRCPLVYGPGAKGSLYSLMRIIDLGIPLPIKYLEAERSLIGLDNLCDILVRLTETTFDRRTLLLVADGADFSTKALIVQIGDLMGKACRIFHLPQGLTSVSLRVIGRSNLFQKTFSSLLIDSSYLVDLLSWKPMVSATEELDRMVMRYKKSRR